MESNGLFKISSGAGRTFNYTPWSNHDAYLDTPTGVYRFNDTRNEVPTRGRSWNSNKTATFRSMYFPIYFDLNYPNGVSESRPLGQESALAMHGTNTGAYGRLGRQASHGCIRTHQQVNWCVKNQYHQLDNSWTTLSQVRRWNDPHGGPLINVSQQTPFLETRIRLKSEEYDASGIILKPGSDGLFIIFYGYDETLETGVPVEI
ncbi:MAG: L,D-transpeptidase [Bdellovibrionales bacterium]|nr:L,D-transpeptidase [Bdellovibrionales bacterium]NQZ17915.1 L,D-transpeptidase [Bdellovibrionales bacterium]